MINESDSGGTHIDKRDGRQDPGERITVPSEPLLAVLAEAGLGTIDAAEDRRGGCRGYCADAVPA